MTTLSTILGIIGALSAIAVLAITIGRVIADYSRVKQTPFKMEFSLINGSFDVPSNDNINAGIFEPQFEQWFLSSSKMNLESNRDFTLRLQLNPLKSCDLNAVEIRFIKEGKNQPEIGLFSDINPQTRHINMPSCSRAKGYWLQYGTEVHTNMNGKALDYWAVFKTFDVWKGELSIRLSIVGLPEKCIKIPAIVKYIESSS